MEQALIILLLICTTIYGFSESKRRKERHQNGDYNMKDADDFNAFIKKQHDTEKGE